MNKNKINKIFTIIFKLLYYLVVTLACLIVLFLLYYIISSQLNADNEDYKPKVSIYTIVSPSMTPVINVYDVVVNVRVDNPEDIEIGDIITYVSTSSTSEGMTITHRVVEISTLPDGTYEYMTQGDNNSEPDSSYVLYDQVVGKKVLIIPYLGRLQLLVANHKGWLFLLLIPIAIYIFHEIYKLIDLFGLRRKVNKVVGTTEDSLIDRKKAQKELENQRKETIKEELLKKEIKQNYLVNNTSNNKDTGGFLETYTETIISVSVNKYTKDKKTPLSSLPNDEMSLKVNTGKNIPTSISQIPNDTELPKSKDDPLPTKISKEEPIEILDTDELSTKIKEYDTKIIKLDQMIADIERISKPLKESLPKETSIEENYLKGGKIKVINMEPTKNQPRKTPSRRSKTPTPPLESTQSIELKPLLNSLNNSSKQSSKKVNKDHLNLNPHNLKKLNRPSKTSSKASNTPTKVNDTKVKNSSKSQPKAHFIEIKKVK